jgi:glycosyltransferase involved in cell wall biosynthesis
MNKICHCSVIHRINDSRIFYKECVSLANAGYDVSIFAIRVNNVNFNRLIYKGVFLHGLNNNRIFNHFYLLLIILKKRYKIIHFHDPELIFIGFLLKLFGKKIIYDVHENYRQTIMNKKWVILPFRFIFSKILIFLEFISSIFFDLIITTTPVIANNFKYNNTHIIRNFPIISSPEFFTSNVCNNNVIIYIGSLSSMRGIKELITAAGHLIGVSELWLLGPWEDESFKSECELMVGYNNTKYLGLVNHEDVKIILHKATIGICLLHPIDSFKDSYPIKVFEYMQSGLPILMSNFDMWQQLFGNSCEYIDPMNPLKIAEKIMEMLNNPDRLEEMSRECQILVNEHFNWNSEARLLIESYKKILN